MECIFIYYVLIFGRFVFSKDNENKNVNIIPISVIICAKNEEENVKKFIPLLAEQNYPDFEIVLIDDASSDNTLEIFEAFEKEYQNVKLVKVENNEAFWGSKKFALTLGIKAATKPNLLFIDADCYPVTKQWIAEMSSCFDTQKSIVLGYGAYEKIKGSFLNKIIRFETLLTATQYFSWAKIGKPYMGVGRNLGYKKVEFFQANGFIKHMQIRSGDDDLFVNQIANVHNTVLCLNPESFTYSEPKQTFTTWINQKRRHVATAKYYKNFDKIQLAIFYVSQLLFIILPIILLLFLFHWDIVLVLVAFRYLFAWICIGFSAGKLQEKDMLYLFPILEISLTIAQLHIFLINCISKPVHWK